jgi:AhpD family alkylhydroperoxidase
MHRMDVSTLAPEGFRRTLALTAYVTENLDDELFGLVELRASQMNGCAYCVDMHASALHKLGVPFRTIVAVSAWRDTSFFSDAQRAALALTEEVTDLPGGVDDATWAAATQHLGDRALADLVIGIGVINLWNRICVTTELPPPPLSGEA